MQIEQNVQTLAGRYKIQGNVRFLSHQEAMRAIQRSLIRSGVNLLYSQGYNPRPRLSLPLPKSVGLESEDELFKKGAIIDDIYFCPHHPEQHEDVPKFEL